MAVTTIRQQPGAKWRLVRAYYEQCGPNRRLIPLMLLLLFLDALLHAAMPAFTGYLVDGLVNDLRQFIAARLPWFSAGALIAILLFYAIASTHHYLMQGIGHSIGIQFQVRLYDHVQRLGADFYQRNHVGEIVSRLTNDIGQGVTPLFTNVMVTFWSLCVLAISCISMAYISVPLLCAFLAVSLCMVALTKLVSARVHRLTREVRDESGRITARMTETIAANPLIRSFAQEGVVVEGIREHTDAYLRKLLRTVRLTVLFTDIMNTFIAFLAPVTLLLIGAYFVGEHGITVGGLVAAFGYWRTVAGPISAILGNITALFTAFASMDRIMEYFDEAPSVQDVPEARPLEVTAGEIELRAVTFGYPAEEHRPVLDALSLTIPGTRSLAIVGESGAGKSTITSLLLRFYDPQAGQVLIDGQDLRQVTQDSLRRQIGYVMQETILLSGTVSDNLRLAKPDATEDEIIAALVRAEAWEFVQQLPHGMETMLGERGARLSGGQKQRLAIARVFLKNPPIVIFDEATSALDAMTEAQIQTTMRALFADRTAIIIAHRLSTVVECDRILLLDAGRIAAQGTHAELLAVSDRYRELCRKQFVLAER